MAKPELRDHRKFLKLKRLLGEPTPHIIGYLECLWIRGYQTGSAFIGDAMDVEGASEYPGEVGKLASALMACGFLDDDGTGHYSIHDLYEHAPRYVKRRMGKKGNGPKGEDLEDDDETESATVGRPTGPQNDETRPARTTMVHTSTEIATEVRPPQEPRTQNQEPKAENQEPRTENLKPKTKGGSGKRTPFAIPTVEQVKEYCSERKNSVDPQRFVDFYTSKGWKVGSEAMKDWQACVRTWEQRDDTRGARSPPTANGSTQSLEDEIQAGIARELQKKHDRERRGI